VVGERLPLLMRVLREVACVLHVGLGDTHVLVDHCWQGDLVSDHNKAVGVWMIYQSLGFGLALLLIHAVVYTIGASVAYNQLRWGLRARTILLFEAFLGVAEPRIMLRLLVIIEGRLLNIFSLNGMQPGLEERDLFWTTCWHDDRVVGTRRLDNLLLLVLGVVRERLLVVCIAWLVIRPVYNHALMSLQISHWLGKHEVRVAKGIARRVITIVFLVAIDHKIVRMVQIRGILYLWFLMVLLLHNKVSIFLHHLLFFDWRLSAVNRNSDLLKGQLLLGFIRRLRCSFRGHNWFLRRFGSLPTLPLSGEMARKLHWGRRNIN
jgi:hypothetical protein